MSECMTQEDAMNMSTEQAIQMLKPMQMMMRDQHGCPISDAYFALGKAIEALEQKADAVERKKGKWDFIGFQMFRCTACKHVFSQDSLEGWRTYTYEPTFPKFCPNCGAEMRGEANE